MLTDEKHCKLKFTSFTNLCTEITGRKFIMTLFNLNMSWMSALEFKYIYMQNHKLWPINKAETSNDKIAVSDPTKQPQFNHIIMQMVQSWQTDPHTVPVFCYTPCMFLHGCGWAHPVEQLELLAVLLDHLSPWFCVSSKHATQHHKVGSSPKSLGYITWAGTASILQIY